MSTALSNIPSAHILIIDDAPEDCDTYRQFLLRDRAANYVVETVDTGETGLADLQTNVYDLILLDMRLPDMDGLEVVSALHHQPDFSTPIVMLTGLNDAKTAVQAMKQGVQDYLIKSQVTQEVLQLAVRNVLQRSQLQIQLGQQQQQQAMIAATALRMRQTLNVEDILNRAVIELHKLLQCDRTIIYQFQADMSGKVVAESVHDRWSHTLHQAITDTCFQNGSGKTYTNGKKSVIQDVHQADISPCHRELLQQFEVQANLVVPLIRMTPAVAAGKSTRSIKPKLWGLLIAHQCEGPRVWQATEVELVEALAVQLALAIQQAELLSQTKASLQRESELNTLKSHILSTISHEYRAPLTSILAAATTLTSHRRRLPVARQDKFLHMIAQKARHLASLVDDMMFMNQMEQEQVPLKLSPMDLGHFLSEWIEQYQEQAAEHQITLTISGDVAGFQTDPKILRQILNNLLSNAVKYSPTGSQITVQLHSKAAQVILVVQDQGVGIPPEDQATLFEPFHRGSNVGEIAGTGLGLSILKACTELLGGTVACQSEVGQGTRMTIGFPKWSSGHHQDVFQSQTKAQIV